MFEERQKTFSTPATTRNIPWKLFFEEKFRSSNLRIYFFISEMKKVFFFFFFLKIIKSRVRIGLKRSFGRSPNMILNIIHSSLKIFV